MSKQAEKELAETTRSQFEENLRQYSRGLVNPLFAGLPTPILDPTSPIGQGSDDFAAATVNKVPIPDLAPNAPLPRSQSKKEMDAIINDVAKSIGYLVSPSHFEDLYIISRSVALTTKSVWMYLRGAMRSSHLSVVLNLEKAVKSLETIAGKSQTSLMAAADTSRQLTEKIALLSVKVDNISPVIGSMITNEFRATRIQINNVKAAIVPPPASTAGPSTPRELHPGAAELTLMFQAGRFPHETVLKLVDRYLGLITWEEYEQVVTGRMLPEDIKDLARMWQTSKPALNK